MVALLAAAGMLLAAVASAHARPHAPPKPWVDPMGPPSEAGAWLRRLVGRYRADGMVHVEARGACGLPPPAPDSEEPESFCETIKGMVDCVGIGEGPGVQCILQLTWPDMFEVIYPPEEDSGVYNLPGGVTNLAPAMALFGIDPGEAALNHLLVDQKGLADGGPGFNSGSRMTFRTPCVNWPTLLNSMRPSSPIHYKCERIMRIDARPDAKVVHLSMDIEIDEDPFTRLELTLRPMPQARSPEIPAAPSGRRR